MTNAVPGTPASGPGCLRSPPPRCTAELALAFPVPQTCSIPPALSLAQVLRQSDPGPPSPGSAPARPFPFCGHTEHPPFWALVQASAAPGMLSSAPYPHLLNAHHPSGPSSGPTFLGKLPRAKRMSPSQVLSQPLGQDDGTCKSALHRVPVSICFSHWAVSLEGRETFLFA